MSSIELEMSEFDCPLCGAGNLVERAAPESFRKGTIEITYERVFSVCDKCNCELTSAYQLDRNRKLIVQSEGKALGAPTPEAISQWRKSWGLNQAVAGRMLDVGIAAFSKYENSVIVPSGPTRRLLKVLMASQSATTSLAEICGVTLAPEDGPHRMEMLSDQFLLAQAVEPASGRCTVVLCNMVNRPVASGKSNVKSEENNGAQAARTES